MKDDDKSKIEGEGKKAAGEKAETARTEEKDEYIKETCKSLTNWSDNPQSGDKVLQLL